MRIDMQKFKDTFEELETRVSIMENNIDSCIKRIRDLKMEHKRTLINQKFILQKGTKENYSSPHKKKKTLTELPQETNTKHMVLII